MERRAPGACLISNSCVSITFSSSNVGLVMCDIKFYVSYIGYRDKALRQDHAFKELSNPNIRSVTRLEYVCRTPGKRWLERNASKMEKTSFFPNDGPIEPN